MAKLVFKRKNTMYYLFRVPFSIFVDGKQIASIYPSQKVEYDIKEGNHLIEIQSSTKRIEQQIIIKKDTNSVEILIGAVRVLMMSLPVIREIIYK